ncbi:hypothetical protein [Halopseudomonas pertucinogena]|uniref:Uncharacterized protein n=1 Tax=Halopseudomonas pertucinogena TaxID=86175 RepID=A0ABQ2CS21_9GAMM|nr:hypothetical protein [Halopseudomonas pertucinogena]GGJ06398.1 hypothetical protein GCM10009083_24210 [Halopseudomonas pertucinogena]
MKCFTESELMEKLVEAYRRGVSDCESFGLAVVDEACAEQIESRLTDMIHEDAGGHDGWGKKRG